MIDRQLEVAFLLFPALTQLDLTGPFEVLARVPGVQVHLVAETLEPVMRRREAVAVAASRLGETGQDA